MRKASSAPTQEKKAQFIKLLTEIGPQITQIGSRIGVHKETVRYWYRSLLERGFTVNATTNYEALGLRRVVSILKFAPLLEEHADVILSALSELAYLTSFAKAVPDSYYIANFSVAEPLLERWHSLMNGLLTKGIFGYLETTYLGSVRNAAMKGEFFNFDSGTWEFEWSSPRKVIPETNLPITGAARFDEIDLQIIVNLHLDANKTLAEIAKKLSGMNYKTVEYHFRAHVQQMNLIKGYGVSWLGTTWDAEFDKARHRRHRYLPVEVLIKEISEAERLQLTGMLSSIPFLWLEGGEKNYYAKMVFPLEQIPEALKFLEEVIAPFDGRARWFFMDQKHSVWFTIFPGLYDVNRKAWKLEEENILGRFENLLLQARGGIS